MMKSARRNRLRESAPSTELRSGHALARASFAALLVVAAASLAAKVATANEDATPGDLSPHESAATLADHSSPDLVELLGHDAWETREAALHALVARGADAAPTLLRGTHSTNLERSYRARHILDFVDPPMGSVTIYRILLDEDSGHRRPVLIASGHARGPANEPLLVEQSVIHREDAAADAAENVVPRRRGAPPDLNAFRVHLKVAGPNILNSELLTATLPASKPSGAARLDLEFERGHPSYPNQFKSVRSFSAGDWSPRPLDERTLRVPFARRPRRTRPLPFRHSRGSALRTTFHSRAHRSNRRTVRQSRSAPESDHRPRRQQDSGRA